MIFVTEAKLHFVNKQKKRREIASKRVKKEKENKNQRKLKGSSFEKEA